MSIVPVFVAHDYSRPPEYREAIRRALAPIAMAPTFADERFVAGLIWDNVKNLIQASDIALFDLTEQNVNVMIEFGYAQGLEDAESDVLYPHPVLMLEDGAEPPTDAKGVFFIKYSPDTLEVALRESLLQFGELSQRSDALRIVCQLINAMRGEGSLARADLEGQVEANWPSVLAILRRMAELELVEITGALATTRYRYIGLDEAPA